MIVKAIVSLAHGLGLSVVAEGVENRQQLEFLKSLGCDFAQGYFFARPLSADGVQLFLAAGALATAA
jgi:EAL domain-containing protein (putative c-di-GMP-specific phosphodiesterase class I)